MTTLNADMPHQAQRRVIDQAQRFNVLACGRRWGKTQLGVEHIQLPVMLAGQPGAWFAPSTDLLEEAWERMIDVCSPLGRDLDVAKQSRVIRLKNTGGRCDFWTLASSSSDRSKAGRGRKYQKVVIDEAAHARYLEADWTKSIRATLTDLQGEAWFLSTPWGRNYFWRLWSRGHSEPGWASWQMPTATNPYMAAEEINDARGDLPADAFAQEYEAKFLDDAANPFGLQAIRACLCDLEDGPAVAYGGDLAKSHDWTTLVGLNDRGKPCEFHRFQKDWGATKRHIIEVVRGVPTLIDSTGVGDAVVEDLQREDAGIEGFKFTALSKQQLMEGLMAGVQSGRCGILRGVMQNEMESFQYHYKPSGVRYEAPQGMHDDCVMGLALAWRLFDQQTAINLDSVRLFGGASSPYDDGDDDDW